jgi:hypothetical protein
MRRDGPMCWLLLDGADAREPGPTSDFYWINMTALVIVTKSVGLCCKQPHRLEEARGNMSPVRTTVFAATLAVTGVTNGYATSECGQRIPLRLEPTVPLPDAQLSENSLTIVQDKMIPPYSVGRNSLFRQHRRRKEACLDGHGQ